MIRKFKTNLRCEGCVSAIRPHLDGAPGIKSWRADVESPDKVLTVEGDSVNREQVADLLGKAGYQVLEELPAETLPPATPTVTEPKTSYFPLALIVAYILGVVVLVELASGQFNGPRAMTNFMAGFFLVFSFFKLLDLSAFADTYQTYDLIATRSRSYALVYPFIELSLGVAYLLWPGSTIANAVTLVVMLIGTAGVLKTLLAGRKIRCACLGAVFNLPMSYVTLAEDGLMAIMAAAMLLM
jgi:copper chaperone CopZ